MFDCCLLALTLCREKYSITDQYIKKWCQDTGILGNLRSHTPSALNAEAKRSDVPYGHASKLLLGERSEATEPYNKYAL